VGGADAKAGLDDWQCLAIAIGNQEIKKSGFTASECTRATDVQFGQ
jgi:hypothetical protein